MDAASSVSSLSHRARYKHLGHCGDVIYNKKKKLGQGQFGVVYKGVLTTTGEPVAIKVFRSTANNEAVPAHTSTPTRESEACHADKHDASTGVTSPEKPMMDARSSEGGRPNADTNAVTSPQRRRPWRVAVPPEIETLCSLRVFRCPNILYAHNVWVKREHRAVAPAPSCGTESEHGSAEHTTRVGPMIYGLVSEFCAGGDLQHCLQTTAYVSEAAARSLTYQIANALLFMKSRNIIHRDIKPANILLTSDDLEKAVVKIADFGMAKMLRTPPRHAGTHASCSAATPTMSHTCAMTDEHSSCKVVNGPTGAGPRSEEQRAEDKDTTLTASTRGLDRTIHREHTTTAAASDTREVCDSSRAHTTGHKGRHLCQACDEADRAPRRAHKDGETAMRPSPSALFDSELGTPMYMSPERIAQHAYGYKADVYSTGMVLYELMTRSQVRASGPAQLPSAVSAAMQQLLRRHAPHTPAWLDLLMRMTEPDASRRACVEEVLRHGWFDPSMGPPLPPLTVRLTHAHRHPAEAEWDSTAAAAAESNVSGQWPPLPPSPLQLPCGSHACDHDDNNTSATVCDVTAPPCVLCDTAANDELLHTRRGSVSERRERSDHAEQCLASSSSSSCSSSSSSVKMPNASHCTTSHAPVCSSSSSSSSVAGCRSGENQSRQAEVHTAAAVTNNAELLCDAALMMRVCEPAYTCPASERVMDKNTPHVTCTNIMHSNANTDLNDDNDNRRNDEQCTGRMGDTEDRAAQWSSGECHHCSASALVDAGAPPLGEWTESCAAHANDTVCLTKQPSLAQAGAPMRVDESVMHAPGGGSSIWGQPPQRSISSSMMTPCWWTIWAVDTPHTSPSPHAPVTAWSHKAKDSAAHTPSSSLHTNARCPPASRGDFRVPDAMTTAAPPVSPTTADASLSTTFCTGAAAVGGGEEGVSCGVTRTQSSRAECTTVSSSEAVGAGGRTFCTAATRHHRLEEEEDTVPAGQSCVPRLCDDAGRGAAEECGAKGEAAELTPRSSWCERGAAVCGDALLSTLRSAAPTVHSTGNEESDHVHHDTHTDHEEQEQKNDRVAAQGEMTMSDVEMMHVSRSTSSMVQVPRVCGPYVITHAVQMYVHCVMRVAHEHCERAHEKEGCASVTEGADDEDEGGAAMRSPDMCALLRYVCDVVEQGYTVFVRDVKHIMSAREEHVSSLSAKSGVSCDMRPSHVLPTSPSKANPCETGHTNANIESVVKASALLSEGALSDYSSLDEIWTGLHRLLHRRDVRHSISSKAAAAAAAAAASSSVAHISDAASVRMRVCATEGHDEKISLPSRSTSTCIAAPVIVASSPSLCSPCVPYSQGTLATHATHTQDVKACTLHRNTNKECMCGYNDYGHCTYAPPLLCNGPYTSDCCDGDRFCHGACGASAKDNAQRVCLERLARGRSAAAVLWKEAHVSMRRGALGELGLTRATGNAAWRQVRESYERALMLLRVLRGCVVLTHDQMGLVRTTETCKRPVCDNVRDTHAEPMQSCGSVAVSLLGATGAVRSEGAPDSVKSSCCCPSPLTTAAGVCRRTRDSCRGANGTRCSLTEGAEKALVRCQEDAVYLVHLPMLSTLSTRDARLVDSALDLLTRRLRVRQDREATETRE